MKLVGIGDLVTDYYFVDGKFKGLCGGMTSFNIISHLAKDFDTYAYGVCGNDYEGNIVIESLKKLGVNIDNVTQKNIDTRCFYISIKNNENDIDIKSKKSCPFCENKKWYANTLLDNKLPKEFLSEDTIIIMDTINKVNLSIADQVLKNKGKVFVDIGQIGNLKYLTLKELKEKLMNRFDIVQLNERVANFLVKKMKFNSYIELNKIFNANILTITHGKKGATFVYNEKERYFKTLNIAKETDPSGAGDSFYSEIIREYLNNNFIVTDDVICNAYSNAANTSNNVVQVLGARGTLENLYSKESFETCICGKTIAIDEDKKTRKKSLVNIANLENRIFRTLESDGYNQLVNILKTERIKKASLFIGAGGSRSSAYFASRVINELYGTTCIFLNPREVMYRNNNDINNIYAFSYSGTSPDITYVVNSNDINSIIISKKKEEKIKDNYTNDKVEFVSYGNAEYSTGRERGFLSFEGMLAPATLFAKLYYNNFKYNISFENFMHERFEYWNEFFKVYFDENKSKLKEILDKKNLIDIFYGDYTTSAALDLESKIVESGVYRVEMHEKKNFSHGRFITFEHYMPDAVIYLKTKKEDKYEQKLQTYIENMTENIIYINTEYEGLLGEYDLLIAIQFFVANISKMLDIDLSKPDYSEEAMKIYRYDGKL